MNHLLFQQRCIHILKETIKSRGQEANKQWDELFARYSKEYPELAEELTKAMNNELMVDLADVMPSYENWTFTSNT